MRIIKTYCVSVFVCGFAFAPWALGQETDPEYGGIQSLLQKNCVACHNAKLAEGGLALDSLPSLLAGGDSGAAIVAGDSQQGELLLRLVAEDDSAMPPPDNVVDAQRLTETEIGQIKAWIERGARPGPLAASTQPAWRDLSPTLKPIYALSLSPDENYLSFGSGNSVALLVDPLGADPRLQWLVDPSTHSGEEAERSAGSASGPPDAVPIHRDLIHSIAFSSDSQTLATGAYRCIKLWQRQTQAQRWAVPGLDDGQYLDVDPDRGYGIVLYAGTELRIVDLASGDNRGTLSLASEGDADATPLGVRARWSAGGDAVFLQSGRQLWFWPIGADGKHGSAVTRLPRVVPVSQEASVRPQPTFDAPPLPHCITNRCTENGVVLISPSLQPEDEIVWADDAAVLVKTAAGHLMAWVGDDDPVSGRLRWRPNSVWAAFTEVTDATRILSDAGGTELGETELGETAGGDGGKPSLGWAIASEQAIHVTNDQGEIIKTWSCDFSPQHVVASPDGRFLIVGDSTEQTMLWDWRGEAPPVLLPADYDHSQHRARASADAQRQQKIVERLKAKLPALQEVAAQEQAAVEKAEQRKEEVRQTLETRSSELDTARQAVAQTQRSIEEVDASLQALQQQLKDLQTELETKQTAVQAIEAQKLTAEADVVKQEQALRTVQDACDRAKALVPQLEQQIADEDQMRQRLELDNQTLHQKEPAQCVGFAVSPNHRWLIRGNDPQRLSVYELASGKPIATLHASMPISNMLITPEDRLWVWGTTSIEVFDLNFPWVWQRTLESPEFEFSDRITALDFSPDGHRLAVGSGAASRFGDVKIFQLPEATLHRDLGPLHSDSVLGVRFSPNGRFLATCGADKLCRVLDVDSGEVVRVLEGHTHHVMSVDWQDDLQSLVTAGADASVKSWDWETGERRNNLGGFGKEVSGVTFVGHSDQVLSASIDGQIRLHQNSDGQHLKTMGGTDSALFAVAATADGRFVIAGGQSGSLWVWKVDDATLFRKFPQD